MKLLFRIDDVTPTMDWKRFYGTLDMLLSYGIKPMLGVIPSCKDEKLLKYTENKNFWDEIKKLYEEGYLIALHGYEHLYVTEEAGIFPVNNYSEFAGLSYEEQYEKIKKGKKILEDHGIKTDIFMAPAHSFDENTCRALLDNGIHYITDGFGKECYKSYGIIFLPIVQTWRRAYRIRNWGYATVVMHTNLMNDVLMKKYEKVCEKHKNHTFSWDEIELEKIKIVSKDKQVEQREFVIYKVSGRLAWIKNKCCKFVQQRIKQV